MVVHKRTCQDSKEPDRDGGVSSIGKGEWTPNELLSEHKIISREKIFLDSWSRGKVIFLLAPISCVIVSTACHSIYFSIYQEYETQLDELIFLLPIVLNIYVTTIAVRKTSGVINRIFLGVQVFLAQLVIFATISIFFVMLDSFGGFVTPEYIKNDEKLEQSLIEKYITNYGISVVGADEVLHSSYYRIGEEFGTDLIFKQNILDKKRIRPLGNEFTKLTEKTSALPFRFSNRQFLCNDGSEILIQDVTIRNLICSKDSFPSDVLISEKKVREDWSITAIVFPSKNIVWITEIEW